MEKKMEATMIGSIGITGLYWGSTGIMEKKIETTIIGLGFRRNGKDYGNIVMV